MRRDVRRHNGKEHQSTEYKSKEQEDLTFYTALNDETDCTKDRRGFRFKKEESPQHSVVQIE